MTSPEPSLSPISSPSSRRAWVEIGRGRSPSASQPVALLAEGVGRNIQATDIIIHQIPSPSSRRAWVEIATEAELLAGQLVALLAEGVGRNRVYLVRNAVAKVALLAEGVGRNR